MNPSTHHKCFAQNVNTVISITLLNFFIFYLIFRSSLGLQELNSNNINEFFEAIHNAESLGMFKYLSNKELQLSQ